MRTPPKGELVRLARQMRGLKQNELERKAGLPTGTLTHIENGTRRRPVPEDRIQAICRALELGPDFLFGTCRLRGSLGEVHFRRSSSASAPERHRRVAQLSLLQHLVEECSALCDPPEPARPLSRRSIPDFLDEEREGRVSSAAHAAYALRLEWGIPPGPISNLLDVIESAGIFVACYPMQSELDGLSMWPEDGLPVVILNSGMPGCRQRLTLAHELGHLLLHSRHRDGHVMESEAWSFAAEFLAPVNDIFPDLSLLTTRTLEQLKLEWGISMSAIARRAHELGAIAEHAYRGILINFQKRGWRKAEPVRVRPESPRLLPDLIKSAAGTLEGELSELGDRLGVSAELDIAPFLSSQAPPLNLVR